MSDTQPRILVTGASGQLGRLVVRRLAALTPSQGVVAMVRDPAKATDLAALGVAVRQGDYERPDTLDAAFAGVDRLLLVSSNTVGSRASQHRSAVEAAKRAGVRRIVYTSILHADTTPLKLAAEHKETEATIRASGIPFVILRNGWYTENFTGSLGAALAHGAQAGAAGEGRFSAASRADYADAAAAVLTASEDEEGRVHELAGDEAFTLGEYAAEVARQSGRPFVYRNLAEAEYTAMLVGAGLPDGFAAILADADVGASGGALFDGGRQLSRLIGRPTTPMAETVGQALKG